MRVVFDTNISVSAFVFPGSHADAAIRRVLGGVGELVISRPIIDELLTVLARKFARDADELGRIALLLSDLSSVVRPRRPITILAHEADNRILECARTGRVDLIVTTDGGMLALGRYRDIEIKSLRECVAL
ncbi:putative toxin-antitoxin system toxin component, PIN family [Lentisalinibacter sediminis]|uniref:putative toxin-antitoxin system toxin component, PIN family n=1 Tax=Lentisalinibacter sediminis TaxID=2992237 RepID=UPI00386BAC61